MRLEAELEAAYALPCQAISYASVKQLPYLVSVLSMGPTQKTKALAN